MTIRKQEFYEGAALHLLARSVGEPGLHIAYANPFFVLNGLLYVYFKHTAGGRSPWSYSFTPDEQRILTGARRLDHCFIGFICGDDGVATIDVGEFQVLLAKPRVVAIHVSCVRLHGQHYDIKGPDGRLPRKVSPSRWQRILSGE